MDTQRPFSLKDLRVEHLWTQRDHLRFVRDYHLWLMNNTDAAMISDLHRTFVQQISEAIAHLDRLIEALYPTHLSETTQTPSLYYEDASTTE